MTSDNEAGHHHLLAMCDTGKNRGPNDKQFRQKLRIKIEDAGVWVPQPPGHIYGLSIHRSDAENWGRIGSRGWGVLRDTVLAGVGALRRSGKWPVRMPNRQTSQGTGPRRKPAARSRAPDHAAVFESAGFPGTG